MDISTEKLVLNTVEKINEIPAEQSVDTEFTLPDYYPEISKILKCLADVNVITKQARGNTAEIGGQVTLTLLYADKENGINSFTHVFPFAKSVDFNENIDDSYISCVLRSEFLNSKATAPRKIEIHGSVTLGVSLLVNKKIECLCSVDDQNVFSKCTQIECLESHIPITKSIFLEDEISIGSNQNAISKILRSNAVAVINECKVITNKIVVKGQLHVEILYCSVQNNRPLLATHTHAFSQIIDIDKELDNIVCTAKASVATFELHPKTSLDGEVKSVTFESKVIIDVFCDKRSQICVVTDAFNNCKQSSLSCIKLDSIIDSEKINENFCFNKSLDFSDGAIGEVYDLWCKTRVNFASCDNGELLIKGVVVINVLGCDSDNSPSFFERSVDYEYRYNYNNDGNCKFKQDVSVAAVNYNKNPDGGIDLSIELNVNGEIYKLNTVNVISDINFDDRLITRDNDTAITLYFAEGESVWDIAKKYLADPKRICVANNIDNLDEPCNKILLIPNI